jgi:hypothetical protein
VVAWPTTEQHHRSAGACALVRNLESTDGDELSIGRAQRPEATANPGSAASSLAAPARDRRLPGPWRPDPTVADGQHTHPRSGGR